MKAIIIIQDELKGSWHQITIDHAEEDCPVGAIRQDGTLLEILTPVVTSLTRFVAEWNDEYEGLPDE